MLKTPRIGITPLITTVLIIAVALSIGITLYYFTHRYVSVRMSLSRGEAILTVEETYWRGAIVAFISNHGTSPGVINKAYLVAPNGSAITPPSNLPVEAPIGASTPVIISTTGLPPGNYRVVLSGPNLASRLEFTVNVGGYAIDSLIGTVPTAASIHSPMEPIIGFNATYYDISSLPTISDVGDIVRYGQVILSKIDSIIDFTDNSYYGGSSWGLPKTDRFAAIYKGFIYMKSPGVCSFNVLVDDGIIIYVDGEEVLKSWKLQAPTSYTATVPLGPGVHNITICYFENYGIARLKVIIAVEEQFSKLIKLSIYGKYFNTQGANPSQPDPSKVLNDELPLIYEGCEERIDYIDLSSYEPTYGGEPWPFQDGTSDLNTFAAHWMINATVLKAGKYIIKSQNDDGVRVYVDGNLAIDDWSLHAPRWNSAEVYLDVGTHRIDVIYYECYGIARMYFSIMYEGEEEELAPAYVARVYDISSYSAWWDLDTLYNKIVEGDFPLIGTYGVSYIDYSDSSSYPADPWFFTSDHPSTDYFAVIFYSNISVPKACTLVIDVVSDDGIKILLDGNVVLEDWSLHAPRSSSASVSLSAGEHSLRVVYFERTGIARLKVKTHIRYGTEEIYPDTGGELIINVWDLSALPSKFHVTVIDARSGSVVGDVTVTMPSNASPPYTIKVRVSKELPLPGAVAIWR